MKFTLLSIERTENETLGREARNTAAIEAAVGLAHNLIDKYLPRLFDERRRDRQEKIQNENNHNNKNRTNRYDNNYNNGYSNNRYNRNNNNYNNGDNYCNYYNKSNNNCNRYNNKYDNNPVPSTGELNENRH